jgi:Tfp pilus assembly protein PilX
MLIAKIKNDSKAKLGNTQPQPASYGMKFQQNKNRGIAIYMAVIITAALSLVSLAVINITLKQISISSASRDSQAAFYSADSGIECALYWDLKNPADPTKSAFSTSTASAPISCNNFPTFNVTNDTTPNKPDPATTTFSLTFLTDPYCVTVGVHKSWVAGVPKTQIEAKGYNAGTLSGANPGVSTCISSNARRVERAIFVNY